MRSIRSRLLIGLTLVLALLLLGQWLWLTLTIDRLIEKQLITRLQEETESVLANIQFDPQGRMTVDPSGLGSSYQRVFSGLYYTVKQNDQHIYSRSLWDSDLETEAVASGQRKTDYLPGPQEQSLLAVSAGYQKQGRRLTVTVAEDIRPMQREKQQLQWMFKLISAVGLLLLILLQAVIINRALQPLKQTRQQLIRLSRGEISEISEQGPAEIQPLLSELNRLMTSMVAKTRRSRQALGNLAHRLKTQLSLLNQVAESEALQDRPSVREQIQQPAADIRRIIDRELKRARVAGLTLPGKGVDLPALVEQLVDTIKLIYRDKSLQIDWQISQDARFNGDREDLLELLGNLLDNAAKWCQGQIKLSISQEQGLKLVVADDGPGCDVQDLSSLSQRGFRADESLPGSGLGLAIVWDIVESYSGKLEFERDSVMGGLQVTVHLQAESLT
jgi:signal transduction histidine kinase